MAITARYGTLNTGTVLRTDEAYAKHLVEDCGAAKYTTVQDAKTMPVHVGKPPVASRKKADKPDADPQTPDPAAQTAQTS